MLVPSSNWRPNLADPKLLFNKILEATIKEEDMYQEGLMKIFFRAGMLALLESRRSNRLNKLIALFQKNVKRRLAMQHYQKMRSSAIRIQTRRRGILTGPNICARCSQGDCSFASTTGCVSLRAALQITHRMARNCHFPNQCVPRFVACICLLNLIV